MKHKHTKLQKLLATEDTLEKKQYTRAAMYHSRKTYEQHKDEINPHNSAIGRGQHHLEHKVSRHVGFLLRLPLRYLCSKHNLTILEHKTNSSKGGKCSMNPTHLLEMCGASVEEIQKLQQNPIYLHLIELEII